MQTKRFWMEFEQLDLEALTQFLSSNNFEPSELGKHNSPVYIKQGTPYDITFVLLNAQETIRRAIIEIQRQKPEIDFDARFELAIKHNARTEYDFYKYIEPDLLELYETVLSLMDKFNCKAWPPEADRHPRRYVNPESGFWYQ